MIPDRSARAAQCNTASQNTARRSVPRAGSARSQSRACFWPRARRDLFLDVIIIIIVGGGGFFIVLLVQSGGHRRRAFAARRFRNLDRAGRRALAARPLDIAVLDQQELVLADFLAACLVR